MNIPCRLVVFSVALFLISVSTGPSAQGQQFTPPRTFPARFTPPQDSRTETEATYPVGARNESAGSTGHLAKSEVRTLSTSMTGFGVPFKINDTDGRFIEVQLYVSKNRGKSWQFQDRKSPSETEFPFYSQGDGEYWFALKTLDRDRKLHPDGDTQPELKVFVDTRRPQLEFAVKPDAAGRVVCKWRAQDIQIDPSTVRLSYQPSDNPNSPWTEVDYRPIQPNADSKVVSDQIAWWPDSNAQQINVRFQIADQAGNEAVDQRTILVPQVAMRNRSTSTAHRGQPQCAGGVCKIPGPDRLPGPQDMFGNSLNEFKSALKKQVGSPPEFAAPPKPIPSADFVTASTQKPVSLAPNPQQQNTNPVLKPKDSGKNIEWDSQSVSAQGLQKQVVSSTAGQGRGASSHSSTVASKSTATQPTHSTAPGTAASSQHTFQQTSGADRLAPITPRQDAQTQSVRHAPLKRPNVQPVSSPNRIPTHSPAPAVPLMKRLAGKDIQEINSHRFLLNYNIDSIDPSGVGKVVLWTTQDGGDTWKSWASDNDNVTPFPVKVEENGIFGFRVVIHSNDGLSGRPPVRGDEADMWVRIDTEAPKAKIVSAPYGSGNEAGRLIINWTATDEKLRTKPIKLAYSTAAQGPWTTIEEGLRNTGSYAWKVPRGVPDQIYLRLQVTDSAGNTTVQQLTRPLDVSGLVPRGRINSVQPVVTN